MRVLALPRRLVGVPALLVALLAPAAASSEGLTVSLLTSDGVTLIGTFYPPARQPAPMVLLLHMPTRTRADWDRVGPRLAERGIGALAIDFRGHGESGPAPPAADGAPDPRHAVRDVQAALAWLRQRPDTRAGHLGIVGASLGANLAAVAAATDPAVRALVLLSITLDFRGVRAEAALKAFGTRPALLVASQEDGYAARSARGLAAAAPGPRELRLLEGAGHGTTMLVRQPEVVGDLVDWLAARLL